MCFFHASAYLPEPTGICFSPVSKVRNAAGLRNRIPQTLQTHRNRLQHTVSVIHTEKHSILIFFSKIIFIFIYNAALIKTQTNSLFQRIPNISSHKVNK